MQIASPSFNTPSLHTASTGQEGRELQLVLLLLLQSNASAICKH
jgi:hypothetical protein